LLATLAQPALADDDPPTSNLVWAGLGMAVPTYFLGVAVHEGSHALAARMIGADLLEFHVLPGVRHGRFYFGFVRIAGLESRGERLFFQIAPKLSDLALLGTYAALVFTDSTPHNAYGQLALAVLATGFWVDFSKDIPSWFAHSDIVKIYNMIGATTELRRLPLRLAHAGVSAAAAITLWRGYRQIFDREDAGPGAPLLVPLALLRF
jgi:hypothetical protein